MGAQAKKGHTGILGGKPEVAQTEGLSQPVNGIRWQPGWLFKPEHVRRCLNAFMPGAQIKGRAMGSPTGDLHARLRLVHEMRCIWRWRQLRCCRVT